MDSKSSKDTLILLNKINKEFGTTIIMLTHNTSIQMMDKIITMKDGKIVDMKINDSPLPTEEIQF